MRNLVVAYEVARRNHKQPAVVIVYIDKPHLPMAKKVKTYEWSQFTTVVRQEHVPLHVRSYQEILSLAQQAGSRAREEQKVWQELAEWVNKKTLMNHCRRY